VAISASKPTDRAEAAIARLSAGTSSRRAAAATEVDRLLERIDWKTLGDGLAARQLLSLLGKRIIELAGERTPAWFVEATERAIEVGAERDALLELLSIQLIDSLEADGVRSLTLKGPALGRALYGGPGRRQSADIDLLVRAEDLEQAVKTAARLGYWDPEHRAPGERLPLLHRRLVHRQPGLPLLELHWRVHWYEQLFSREMLLRSTPGGFLGLTPGAADELTSLLLYYARDGFVDLKLACDLGAWWDARGSELSLGSVDAQIARYPALERVLVAAAEVADRVVGLPRLALLGEERQPEHRVLLATRLANPDARGPRTQHHADALLIDLLLTPQGGHRDGIRRQLQTPSGVQPGQTSQGRQRTASVNHVLRLLRRYALGLIRVVRDNGRYIVTSRP
jgi:hypothetical protein